jgi:hypothetical protein
MKRTDVGTFRTLFYIQYFLVLRFVEFLAILVVMQCNQMPSYLFYRRTKDLV